MKHNVISDYPRSGSCSNGFTSGEEAYMDDADNQSDNSFPSANLIILQFGIFFH